MITDFSRLSHVISQLGVSISKEAREYQEALNEGIDVDELTHYHLGDRGIFTIDPGGKIHKVLLYITQRKTGGRVPLSDHWEDWHKFHIFNCTTLRNYPPERKHRYKMVSRVDGLFSYTIYDREKIYKEFKGSNRTPLKLCKYCENIYMNQVGEPFDLEKFINSEDAFSGLGQTRQYEFQDVPNEYSEDWPAISKMRKEQKNWKCEKCQIDLSSFEHRKYLHGHHIDGNRANSSHRNIEVLCIKCHAEEALHSHIKDSPDYKEFVNNVLPALGESKLALAAN